LQRATSTNIHYSIFNCNDIQFSVFNVQFDEEADALTLLGRTKEREKLYDFSEPTLTFEFCFFVRSDDPPIETINDLKGKMIGVTKGGYAREVLEPNK
jgi:ABC-type amino acid transport substrate-binding protein